MTIIQKAGVLLRDPKKLFRYCQYSGSRLLYGNGIAKIPSGGRMRISTFSEYLSVYGLMPTKGELAMIWRFLAPAKEVFDIGANVGVWTVLMNNANPKAKVHSFEPNPETHALLERNVKQNNCSNVFLNLAAASDTGGQLEFQVPRNASIFGRVAPAIEGVDKEGRFSKANSFMVPSVRLSDYCNARAITEIDFLKIDVEGHELAALRGLRPFIQKRRVKAIYMETIKENHDRMGTKFSELLSFMYECGYRFHALSKDGDSWDPIAPDQIAAHNHLCLPS